MQTEIYSSFLFKFGHIRRWDQCSVHILYSKISTDPGLLKIRHSHRFVAVVVQILIPFDVEITALRVKIERKNTNHVQVSFEY